MPIGTPSSSYEDGDRGGAHGSHGVMPYEKQAAGFNLGIGNERVSSPAMPQGRETRPQALGSHESSQVRFAEEWWRSMPGFRYTCRHDGV